MTKESPATGEGDPVAAINRLPDHIQSEAPSHWGDFAAAYDTIMDRDPAMQAIREQVVRSVPPNTSSVLDLGAGTASLAFMLMLESGIERYAIVDPEANMLEIARENLGKVSHRASVEYAEGRAEAIPYGNDEFDVIVSNFSLHHVPNANKQAAANEMFRVLKPGGRLIFGDQFCRTDGTPGDKDWSREILDIFVGKAYHYLENASFERMLLQMKIIPRMLSADGEHLVTVEFWSNCLRSAGFSPIEVAPSGPAFLLNNVVSAQKPASRSN